MEVGIVQGVCYYSPDECVLGENGWRLIQLPKLGDCFIFFKAVCRRTFWLRRRLAVRLAGAASSADLDCSSN